MSDLSGSPDIILVWPPGRACPKPAPVPGYSVGALPPASDSWWIDIHRRATPWFAEPDLRNWLARYRDLALPEGILVATEDATGEPVATAGSLANSKGGMFPRGGQLGWVATVPDHRGSGLATRLSTAATRRLLDEGFERLFLCTGDDMPAAISVYLSIGYVPLLHARDQPERWARICDATGTPFRPDDWPRLPEPPAG
jgi:GNAT superfamily N-acetyltransferase